MQFTNRKRRQAPAVIIISLIDVLIVMLIFLMATTTFKQTPPIKLTLPESRQKQPKSGASEENLIVTIDKKEPYLYLNSRPVTREKLQDELIAAVKKNPRSTVSIRPDKDAPVGELVIVFDAAKDAGIQTSLGLYTKSPGQK
jgi:biopolymer transport protein ExbD